MRHPGRPEALKTPSCLTRKLAARLARRRRSAAWPARLPQDDAPVAQRGADRPAVPGPEAPPAEVFLLCDISGSMATFARFTLQFTYAMSTQFSKLRPAFIDTATITEFWPWHGFHRARRVAAEADVVHQTGTPTTGRRWRRSSATDGT